MSQDKDAQIRARAHALWEAEGKPHGRDALHWDQATRELDGSAAAPQDAAEESAQDAIDVIEDAKTAVAAKARKKK
ncbi:DUF2934 domain-containing protein [Sphingobium sufflavum]|uniref:DUF2934 domain-containing protein n=1 Tax=Sphingobium sufflavum TaxID=1129547 RepID=UPI001F44172A|nr:DUF2934 domain-containing protein [Sphingobium sufflavum]MCE7796654.1 DUF2934 domain-containing protein [Sphingobium sufflavum]